MRYFTDAAIDKILENLRNSQTESEQIQRLQDEYSKLISEEKDISEDKDTLISKFNQASWREFPSNVLKFFLNLTEERAKAEFNLEIAKECLRRKDLDHKCLGATYRFLSWALSRGSYNQLLGRVAAEDLASDYCFLEYLVYLEFLNSENIVTGRKKEITIFLEDLVYLSVNSIQASEYLYRIFKLGIGVEKDLAKAERWRQHIIKRTNGQYVVQNENIIPDPDAILKIDKLGSLPAAEKADRSRRENVVPTRSESLQVVSPQSPAISKMPAEKPVVTNSQFFLKPPRPFVTDRTSIANGPINSGETQKKASDVQRLLHEEKASAAKKLHRIEMFSEAEKLDRAESQALQRQGSGPSKYTANIEQRLQYN